MEIFGSLSLKFLLYWKSFLYGRSRQNYTKCLSCLFNIEIQMNINSSFEVDVFKTEI